jgi:F-type H+-transporting ATPase subunit b
MTRGDDGATGIRPAAIARQPERRRSLLARNLIWALSGAGLLVMAAPALAAEGAKPDIFEGGIGNAIVTLVIFVAVVVILGKYAWPPLMRVLAEREQTIRESLEDARREREEAQVLLAKYTEQIEAARTEATGIVDAGRRNAEEVARKVQEEARKEAGEMVNRALREIQLATDTAKKEVYDVAAELAVDVAGRIIRKKLSPEDHQELVEESLERMRAEDAKLN